MYSPSRAFLSQHLSPSYVNRELQLALDVKNPRPEPLQKGALGRKFATVLLKKFSM